ncbi:Diadenosine tetraphosphate (Ap4A) hydrolase and other HIT family hydrolases [invertebrate metagenome]|uniref:Diadenosine tetraphosphate (Ap4A) hydrolase and other HIT family hydrolases n=1 Tax=invertebrate metagenome TaxID=1711999 RepID=A0A484H6M9_9ZZZZ
MDDFIARASDREMAALYRAIAQVARATDVAGSGYRLLCNIGADGGQEVPHLHMHVFGGQRLGRMIQPT